METHDENWIEMLERFIFEGTAESLVRAADLLVIGPPHPAYAKEYRRRRDHLLGLWVGARARLSDEDRQQVSGITVTALEGLLRGKLLLVLRVDEPEVAAGPITDAEVAEFLSTLDTEDGIRRLASGSPSLSEDPLFELDGHSVLPVDIVPLYRPKVTFDRDWSSPRIKWEHALLEDLILLGAQIAGRLTSADRNRRAQQMAPYFRSIAQPVHTLALMLTKRLVRRELMFRLNQSVWQLEEDGIRAAKAIKRCWLSQIDREPHND